MKRALITGITGQDGSYLAELLLSKGYEVHGIRRRASIPGLGRVAHIEDKLNLHWGDLSDATSIGSVIKETKPDEIYNLGAMSDVRISYDIPNYTADVTGASTTRLLEVIRKLDYPVRYYQASSSEMFGKVLEIPQTEKTPFWPRSPYGCAKVFSYWLTINYRESYGIHASNGILFNHESPRRGVNFVTRKITKAAARIRLGLQHSLELGNLDAKRDWGYAGDFVEAMWRMLQQDKPDDYVVATGETHTVKEFLDIVFPLAGLDWHRHVVINPTLFRPAEVDILLGNPAKAKGQLGWEPKVRFKELAEMMYRADYDRESRS